MKIDKPINTAATAANVPARPRPGAAESSSSPASGEVRLSPLAGQVQAGEAQAPFDSERVQAIKQAIAEGRFSINAGAIADRLIDSARDLISSQRRA